ncbi:MAG: PDGLE domain-containing protein [Ornithinimicrobium sp.]
MGEATEQTPKQQSTRRDQNTSGRSVSLRVVAICGLILSLLVAGGLSYYASANPDGLEYVAEEVGFIDTATESDAAGSPLADYEADGVENARFSTGVAGLAGIAVTGAFAYLLFWALRRRQQP